MRIFGPEIIGAVTHKADSESPSTDVLLHNHPNKATLDKFSIQDNKLMYDGQEVEFVTGPDVIVAKFSVENGKLYYDGSPVDTPGAVFANEADLRKLSVQNGELYYNGSPVFRAPYEQIGINVVDTVTAAATITVLSAVTSKLPKDFAGSVGICDKAPGSALALPLKVNGLQVGSINIATSGAVTFTGTEASDIQVSSGTKIQVVLDSMVGSGAGDLSVTLRLGV